MRVCLGDVYIHLPTHPPTHPPLGSDQDTRRRCSCDLIRALCQQFDETITGICLEYISNMVNLYQTNPSAWKSKDAAIHLMLAVTVRAESVAKGASQLNERVDVMAFYTTHVLPELEDANVNGRPIIKADCIKFITTFRQQVGNPPTYLLIH